MTEPETPHTRTPIFSNGYPIVILIMTALITAISLFQFSASPVQEDWLYRAAAIISGPDFAGIERPFGDAVPLLAHTVLHGGVFHLAMNMGALLSIGPILALALGRSPRGMGLFVLFFAVCAIGGGLAEIFVAQLQGANQIAIGASSAISGFLPAAGYIRGGLKGAWSMSVVWIVINIGIALAGGVISIPLAWAAHLGGLAAGFSFPLFLALAANNRGA